MSRFTHSLQKLSCFQIQTGFMLGKVSQSVNSGWSLCELRAESVLENYELFSFLGPLITDAAPAPDVGSSITLPMLDINRWRAARAPPTAELERRRKLMNLRESRKSFEKFHQFRIFPSIVSILLVEHGESEYNYCALQLKQNISKLQKVRVFKKVFLRSSGKWSGKERPGKVPERS